MQDKYFVYRPLLDLIGFTEATDKGRGYNETLVYGAFTGSQMLSNSIACGSGAGGRNANGNGRSGGNFGGAGGGAMQTGGGISFGGEGAAGRIVIINNASL